MVLNDILEKVSKKVFIIIGVILVILLFFTCTFIVHGMSKVSLSSLDFKKVMEKNGYLITDDSDKYLDYGFVKKAYTATDPKANFSIVYFDYNDEKQILKTYDMYKKDIMKKKGSFKSKDKKNYRRVILTGGKKYFVLVCIDNTLVYVSTSLEYKNEVDDILKKIGYR